jgi:hypothetical protein
MTHGPGETIEHAEHAAHAAHDAFNRKVTISIAMVAAVLAAVTMLGHRAHNATLRLQGEALQAQNEAGIANTKVANNWLEYQAYNIRSHMYQVAKEQAEFVTPKAGKEAELEKAAQRWKAQFEKYEGVGDKKGSLSAAMDKAEKSSKEAKDKMDEAFAKLEESHKVHARADRFDFGELGLQLGVVLCSLAILTKSRAFWVLGIIGSVAGAAVAVTGQFGWFMGGH